MAPFEVRPDGRMLDLGCCECDFLERAAAWWPDLALLVGVDQRAREVKHSKPAFVKGDVRDADLFKPASFDAIVALSSVEHVGLGHYGDPVDPDGDTTAIQNCQRWLRPGGWLYFDVPYDPTGYRLMKTKCRIYDDAALDARFPLVTAWVGYAGADAPGRLVQKPTVAHARYWYVAMVWQKPGLEC